MFCSKCGNKIEEGSSFCGNCGNPVNSLKATGSGAVLKKTVYRTRVSAPAGQKTATPPNKDFQQLGAWMVKYKWPLIIALILIVAASVTAKILEPKPDKDAAEVLQSQCNCYNDYDASTEKDLNSFKKDFDVSKYKTHADAYAALTNAQNATSLKLTTCLQAAEQKRQKLRGRYMAQYVKLAIFDNTISANGVTCTRTDFTQLREGINQLINQIKDPAPDVQKIEADLIGREVLGWRFAYLNEFQNVETLNTTSTTNRLEYQLKMHLHDNGAAAPYSEHDCEVMVVYLLGGGGWYLNDVRELYITYIYPAPLNQWQKVQPLPNSRYSIVDGGKNYWAFDGGYVQRKYAGGPNEPGFTFATDDIYIMSRENDPITLTFKYTPPN